MISQVNWYPYTLNLILEEKHTTDLIMKGLRVCSFFVVVLFLISGIGLIEYEDLELLNVTCVGWVHLPFGNGCLI